VCHRFSGIGRQQPKDLQSTCCYNIYIIYYLLECRDNYSDPNNRRQYFKHNIIIIIIIIDGRFYLQYIDALLQCTNINYYRRCDYAGKYIAGSPGSRKTIDHTTRHRAVIIFFMIYLYYIQKLYFVLITETIVGFFLFSYSYFFF